MALDTEKAFDTVWISGLINKIIHFYLNYKKFYTKLHISKTGPYRSESEITVLSPHLYTVMTNDMSLGTRWVHADDTRRLNIYVNRTLISYPN